MSNVKIDREMKNLRYRYTERCITLDIDGQRDEESEIMLEIEIQIPVAGNTKGGSITVLLTSCLTGLD
jgi:hypothetical protein